MPNNFNTPPILPNPDDFVTAQIIDTGGQAAHLNVWKNTEDSAWYSDFISSNVIALTDDAEYTATLSEYPGSGITDAAFMMGLDATNPGETYLTIDYAVYINESLTRVYAYENGASVAFSNETISQGDTCGVRKTGTTIEYLYNGAVFHTSAVPVAGSLVLDQSIRNNYSMMADITLVRNGVQEPILVTSLLGPLHGKVGSSIYVDVAEDGWNNLRDATNYALAEGQANNLWNQDLSDTCVTSTGVPCTPLEWRIPHISDAHTTITVYVTATATVGVGQIRVHSINTGTFGSIPVAVGTATYSVQVNIGSGVEYSEVTMQLVPNGSGTIQVHETFAYTDPLTSPIAAVPMANQWNSALGIPMGEMENVTLDAPLPASKGDHLIDTFTHLYSRPELIACWAGVNGAASSVPMTPDLYRWVWVQTPGKWNRTSGPGGRGRLVNKIKFSFLVDPDPVLPTYIYLQIGDSTTSDRHVIPIAASGAGITRYNYTYRVPEVWSTFPRFNYPVLLIGLWPSVRSDTNRTDANIYGFSAWAEE